MNSLTTPTNWSQRRIRVESGAHKGKVGTWHAKDGLGNHFVRVPVKGEEQIVAVRRHTRLEDVDLGDAR